MLCRYSISLAMALVLFGLKSSAHDIPSDVTAHLFFKPSGGRAQLLVRVPLRAMRDVEFPERDRGYLDLAKLALKLPDAAKLWIADFVEVYEGETRVQGRLGAMRVSLPSDRSFATFEQALAHITGPPLAESENVVWNQVPFDLLIEYPISSERSQFSIRPGTRHLAARVVTVLRFLPPDGSVRAYEFEGDPGVVPLDPRWFQAAKHFVELGFFHILDGTDHLLFLLCLVIPFRRLGALIWVVTSFTLAHSVTLMASAFQVAPDALWFPPFIETLIAASIVYMALENIVTGGGNVQRRWMMAFGFGLVHGFGFSFALRETLQFAGSHLLTSLVSFNVGVELGQLLVLVILVPALQALFRFVVAERMGTIVLSALVAHTGWHWMTDRFETLSKFKLEWPAMSAASIAAAMRWAIVVLILAGLLWLAGRMMRQRGIRALD